MKQYRVAGVALIVGATMFWTAPDVFAEQALTTVTCAAADGTQRDFQIGWDNSNQFFEGRGDIPRLFCEGGYAQPYTTYIGDTLPTDSPLRYYAGIVPTPSPTPSPSVTIEPTPMPTILPSIEPSLTPSLEPTLEPTPEPTPEPSPVVTQPSIAPSLAPVVPPVPPIQPTPTPTLQPSPTPLPEQPTATPEPIASQPAPIPSAIPSLNPQVVTLDVPTQLMAIPGFEELAKTVEAIMNIGSDMTPEQRQESQGVAVAAVLVTQIASSVRRVK